MNIAVIESQSKSSFKLTALTDAWAIEKNDIDDRLSGDDPDSMLSNLAKPSQWIKKKTGADEWTQRGVLNLVPGGSAIAFGLGALGLGVDTVNNFQRIEKANETERVLALNSVPIDTLNWDLTERLIEHIQTWLLPKLSSRLDRLREVLKASGGHEVVSDRIGIYEAATEELKVVNVALRNHAQALNAAFDNTYSAHYKGASEVQKVYEEAKRGVDLSVKALLLSRPEAAKKLEEIDGNYQQLKCYQHGLLSNCEELKCEGENYCPKHLCFAVGCHALVVDKKRYCKEHGKQMSDVAVSLPKTDELSGVKPKEAEEENKPEAAGSVETPKVNTVGIVIALVLGVCVLLGVLVSANSRPEGRKQSSPAPAPKVSSVQPTEVKPSVSIDDLTSLTAAQIENRRLEIEDKGKQSAKKYAAYDEKINILTPRINVGDRDQIVANAKEIMATMEARLIELRAQKDAIEKLMRIYQFIEANPSKLASDTTLTTNIERLKNMTDGYQAFTKAVIDAENQNALSRSALAEVIAAK